MAAGVGRKNVQAVIPQNYICKLPTELTTQLFARVHPQDLLSCNRVCKHWYQAFQPASTWQHLLTRHFSSIKTPEKAEECQAVYKAEYRRRESNLNNGNFCLKPYVPVDGNKVSLEHLADIGTITWDSDIGKVKVVYNKQVPNPAVEIYDAKTDKLVRAFNIKNMTSFLIKGSYLCASSEIDGTLTIANIKTGECRKPIQVSIPIADKLAGATCMAMDSSAIDPRFLFLGCYGGSIKIYDLKEEEFLNFKPNVPKSDEIFGLIIRDRKLISASSFGKMLVWKLDDQGKPIKNESPKVIDGHQGRVQALTYAYGDIFTVSLSNEIKRWNIETGNCMTTIKARQMVHNKKIFSIAYLDHQLFLKGQASNMVMDFRSSDQQIVDEIGRSFFQIGPLNNDKELQQELFDRFAKMSGKNIDTYTNSFAVFVKLLNEGKELSEAAKKAFS